MTRTEIERLTVIETKFETIIEPMALQVQTIHDQMPEIVRKVNAHHNVFNDHCGIMERLAMNERPSDGNGGYRERRKDIPPKKTLRQKLRELPTKYKISLSLGSIPLIDAYYDQALGLGHSVINFLQTLSK